MAKKQFGLSPLALAVSSGQETAHNTAAPAHRTAGPAQTIAALAYRPAIPDRETVAVAHEMPFQAAKLMF